MGKATTTIDHDEIRAWVEARGGRPARVKGTAAGDDLGILTIDFPESAGHDALEHVLWEEWFDAFEENGLAFLAHEETRDGELSRFNKLVNRDEEDDDPETIRRPELWQGARG